MLTARLFGKFTVRRGEQAFEDLIAGTAKELFCYLVVHRDRLVPFIDILAKWICEPPHRYVATGPRDPVRRDIVSRTSGRPIEGIAFSVHGE